jgi:hypothetical protein
MSAEDRLLLEFAFEPQHEPRLAEAIKSVLAQCDLPPKSAAAWVATSAPVLTCYLAAQPDVALLNELGSAASAHLGTLRAGPLEVSRLKLMTAHPGASHNASADFHYVVRTDVAAGGDAELQRWYDEEHLAMLASVPGTQYASRFICLDAAPRYYACYNLRAPAVLQSAEWLTARQTPWSERVRPTFTNTRRVIFRKLDLSASR